MLLSDVSIRRPVAMCSLILALIGLGANAYRKLRLESFPQADSPYVTVITRYPGAAPKEIETDVARKIEDAVVSVDGIRHVTSLCMEDRCITLIELEQVVDVDVAAFDIREKVDLIRTDLPADAEDPEIEKFDINAKPIIFLALTGPMTIDELYDYADDRLSDRFSTLAGVAEVELIGGGEREIHVLLDRRRLAAKGLTTLDVIDACRRGARKIPSGRIREKGREFTVSFDAETGTLQQVGAIQVPVRSGVYVYLRDLGQVKVGAEEYRQSALIDGRPGIAIRIVKKADANAAAVVDRVRRVFDDLSTGLPGGMELTWITDDGDYIQASADSGRNTVIEGIALTAAILLLFLHHVRSMGIVAITMPISVIISLLFMDLLDYSLNMMTLLSLALSVGVLVTMSIVVLESMVRYLERGESAAAAAAKGVDRVVAAVLASAGTNIVVLLPITMMQTRVAFFFIPFALTMVIVTAVSVLVSFTLTPILCSRWLRGRDPNRRPGLLARLGAGWDQVFARLEDRYAAVLAWMEHRRWAAALAAIAAVGLLIHSLSLAPVVGFTFVPDTDQGQLYVKLEFPTYYDLQRTTERVARIERRLRELPHVEHTYVTVGKVEGVIGQNTEGVYLAQILIRFAPLTERAESIEQLRLQARALIAETPDAIVTVSVPALIGGQGNPIDLEISGDELPVLDRLALRTADESLHLAGVYDIDTSVRLGKPEIRIVPDREVLSDRGIRPNDLGTMLRGNVEGIEAATFKNGGRSFDIRVKFAEREGAAQVGGFQFPGRPGRPVAIEALATVEHTITPVSIIRVDKRRVSKVLANLAPTKPLGSAVGEISRLLNERVGLPVGYSYRFAGIYEIMADTNVELLEVGIVAILLTYLLLSAILESWVQPLLILVTLPLALVGMLYGLFLTGHSMSITVLLGAVMLIGIVVNNAILIVSEANILRAKGAPRHDAMIQAARDKLRPIVMITLAAVLGMTPLAVNRSPGFENRNGIGIACVGGIAVSGLLTLIVIPVLYDLFTRRDRS